MQKSKKFSFDNLYLESSNRKCQQYREISAIVCHKTAYWKKKAIELENLVDINSVMNEANLESIAQVTITWKDG